MTDPAAQSSHVRALLGSEVKGELLSDPVSLGAYATDAGIYQIFPRAVVLPLDRDDAVRAVQACGKAGVPILARGGGTSLTGQTVNAAVVIDTSKHLRRILEVNPQEQWVRVEPGLVRDELNAELAAHRLHFAPDPATSDRATIGGMISSNSAGMRSARYGMTIDHLLEVEVALPTGEVFTLSPLDPSIYSEHEAMPGRVGEIHRRTRELVEQHQSEIEARFPKVLRRSGGYSLDALLAAGPMNLAKLIAGSEGTLGFILSAKLRLEPLPACSALALIPFARMGDCLRAVAPISAHRPSAVELLDGTILRLAEERAWLGELHSFLGNGLGGLLLVEFQGDDAGEVHQAVSALERDPAVLQLAAGIRLATDKDEIAAAWALRSNALGFMADVRGARKPTPYIEDAAVPPEHLPDYIEEVLAVCERHGQPVSLYGHASVGLLHLRPLHDLHQPAEVQQMLAIQDEVFEIVLRHGGSWSGEHGDGIIRGEFNARFFGETLYGVFQEIKQLFDPGNLLNPGKITRPLSRKENLRYGDHYHIEDYRTLYHYRDQGGLLRAVEQCTGVGACRRTLSGTMCPSYRATRDEVHSTRGRANALRLALTGQLGEWGLDEEELPAALDLCLSCKACKRECPNGVDMARLKAEYLQYQHMAMGGGSLRDHFFASHPQAAARCSGLLAGFYNRLLSATPARLLLEAVFGLDLRRALPRYVREPLSRWAARHRSSPKGERPQVVLYSDSSMEYHRPEVGQAAIRVLEAAGFEVLLDRPGDSQRVAISRGFLHRAKTEGTMLFHALRPYAERGLPILFCEPSCYSAVKDDLPDLIDDETLGSLVAGQAQMIDAFLNQGLATGRFELSFRTADPALKVLVHTHCHQKALEQGPDTLELLARLPGVEVSDSKAGCCGMAGSFGYEREHYDVSVKIAQDRLLPALGRCGSDTVVVANGFSCRHQIEDLSPFRPLHVVELLSRYLAR